MANRYLTKNYHQINNSWLSNRVSSKIPKKNQQIRKKKKKEETVGKYYNCDDDDDDNVRCDVSFGCGLPNDDSEWLDDLSDIDLDQD